MASYYATTIIPTGQEVNTFDVTLAWNNNITTSTIAGLTAISTLEAGYEGLLGGQFTYQLVTVNTGTQIKVTWITPTIAPVSFIFTDTVAEEVYPFNFTEIESCTGCVSVQWAQCEDEYEIDLGLANSTMYNYTLTHPLTGVEYTQNTTTTNQGVTVWDATTLPELYTVGNVFILTATTTSGADVTFNYSGTDYSCVQITIVNQTSVYP